MINEEKVTKILCALLSSSDCLSSHHKETTRIENIYLAMEYTKELEFILAKINNKEELPRPL